MRNITVREALREAMAEEMRADDRVFLLGEEVANYDGAYKVSKGMLAEFGPRRVIDTPISEYGFTGVSVGAAFRGLRPIVEFMSFNFAMQAIDHIINSAAKTLYMSGGSVSCPIVFRGLNGTAVQVGAQHSQCFASWFAHCPGLKVVSPYDSMSAKYLLKAAIKDSNPVVFLESEIMYGRSFDIDDEAGESIALDKSVVRRVGRDVSVISFSVSVDRCLKAAEILHNEHGIDAEVIDLVSLRPIDINGVISSLRKTHRFVSVEEGWAPYGVGAEIVSVINEHGFDELDSHPIRISGADVPMPYSKPLEAAAIPSVELIVKRVLSLF
ncbi:pyruvate dehydrogenase complex E1 component subunit beta [Candidatus Hydrogenosomobacter endosymbioticus]|uniref:Pyruvate dehydrogenase E1 component subunit beta n=1 Tax=Candidatus Hydrogenosomobacter endosymbioticus TaxID=2558174 RepID=A0ABM7V9I7_9PROT|nr:pyruvate dehydrogenase complex E1 component subunit beta [Candidatus Hydrogenosomobacter endosymbioticus]BDB96467.1 hypothetical protein HYD_6000 [Candidatus Hydrogenosomobacter endosymbioticus]